MYVQSSEILHSQRTQQRMESSLPKLVLSSLLGVERVGKATPMTSVDEQQVDTEEQRR